MPEIHSSDYHDFVFRDGRLVGEFEQMYAKAVEVPWHQDRDGERLDCRLALAVAATAQSARDVLEVGCGLGYFADLLRQTLPEAKITGSDVSATAISKASELFPEIGFGVCDIKQPLAAVGAYDLVVVRGSFWYLFDEMETVVANLCSLVRPGGLILVAQNFPPLDSCFVGKDVLPSPDALVERFFPAFATVVDCRFDDRTRFGGNDNWVLFLGRKEL